MSSLTVSLALAYDVAYHLNSNLKAALSYEYTVSMSSLQRTTEAEQIRDF